MPYSYPAFPHGNKDFNNFLDVCGSRPSLPLIALDAPGSCEPELGGHLIARDDRGPGVISRLFFTSGSIQPNAHGRVLEERIRIYADDLTRPVYDGALASWRDGAEPPFDAPNTRWTSGALVSYPSIPYQTRMRVVLDALRDDSMYYYTVEARSSPPLDDATPSAPGEPLFHEADVQLAGGALQSVFERVGQGQLQHVRFELGRDAALLEQIDLVLEWDDLPQPALDLPLARLFASSQELRAFQTTPLTVELSEQRVVLRLELPMPFAQRARLSLRNRGQATSTLHVGLDGTGALPGGTWGHLHATLREAQGPFTPDQRFVAASATGRGKLIGVAMFCDGRGFADRGTPHPISFLEGDALLASDGRDALHDTGTEDFFSSGWYFQDGTFEAPFGALVSVAADLGAGTARLTALRWLLGDNAVEFSNSLNLQFEYGAFEPLAAYHYAAVAFFYLH